MEVLQKYIGQVKVPCSSDNVYKEECVYSYDSPESPTGLYVSLTTFLGFGEEHVKGYAEKTGNKVYLHIKRLKKELPVDPSTEGPDKKITRLAIGVEGGADPNLGKKKYEYEDTYSVVILPENLSLPYPNMDLPLLVQNSIQSLLSLESASAKNERESLTGTWDGEVRQISKYATDLLQLDNGKKIPPTGWKCEHCDLSSNLWLNLTDGSILCGRKFFDGTGGNNHAVEYYAQTGYPLAVKLGTITAEGKGDVYSYKEDDMVEDPHLVKHLAHFGINVGQMEKTEKSMIELELDLNQRIGEWGVLCESSSNLQPIAGPGYTGMRNLGNSCYLNSVMQVIFTIPDFLKRFVDKSKEIFSSFPADPANDFNIQMAKLGCGLMSGKYSTISETSLDDVDSNAGISPAMFKNYIGKGHPDFSTKMQQDAQEFFLHLIDILEKNSRHQENPADALKFSIEDRVQCLSSEKVKYTQRDDWCLPLQIPLSMATNIAEVKAYEEELEKAEKEGRRLDPDALVRPKIPIQACLEAFGQVETVDQYFSTAINAKTKATKITRLATMPDYFLIHLKKFTLREDWTSVKLDVAVEMPDILDLEFLRGKGIQPGEELLPEMVGKAPTPPPMDPQVMQMLADMGFTQAACQRALFFTKNTGLETATQWMMEHITDNDFNDPFVPPGTGTAEAKAFTPDPVGLDSLMSMGFSVKQCTKALKETNNNIERAVDWIFSHAHELDQIEFGDSEEVPQPAAAASSNEPQILLRDGSGKYKLVAFISHMGKSSQVGHYVCHILKDNQWVIFNDNKVAISQHPPKELGYLYLYKRL